MTLPVALWTNQICLALGMYGIQASIHALEPIAGTRVSSRARVSSRRGPTAVARPGRRRGPTVHPIVHPIVHP